MNKTLSVSAIQEGTVIDHIVAGQALRIINLLNLTDKKVTVGLNLSSKRMQLKDLIKIENLMLSKEEANKITIFAPEATINIIKNFEVSEKIITCLPDSIRGVFVCPNNMCITHVEPMETFFSIKENGNQIKLCCHYCERTFDRNDSKVKI